MVIMYDLAVNVHSLLGGFDPGKMSLNPLIAGMAQFMCQVRLLQHG
jgi:hypothetical protein